MCSLDSIYGEFERVIKRTSPLDDLTWFSQHHGKDMPRSFPQYEVRLRYHAVRTRVISSLEMMRYAVCDVTTTSVLLVP